MFQWMKAKGGCLTNTTNAAIISSKGIYHNLKVNSSDFPFVTKQSNVRHIHLTISSVIFTSLFPKIFDFDLVIIKDDPK